MMTTHTRRRSGFTLLEMILASVIAALLLSALYVAMDIQLRYAQAGREKIEQGTLARALLTRISQDISGCLTPIAASTAAAATSTTSTAATDDSASVSSPVIPFNAGVEGDMTVLTLYVSKVPPRTSVVGTDSDAMQASVADTRRVSYWLVADGGLARQEFDRVSSDDDTSALPPDVADEQKYVIAPEVVGLSFSYFDGNAWNDSWYGSTLGADELTPIGPPRAVEITLQVKMPGTDVNGNDNIKTFRHVVAIGAANAQPVQTTDTSAPATTGTTTP